MSVGALMLCYWCVRPFGLLGSFDVLPCVFLCALVCLLFVCCYLLFDVSASRNVY